MSDALYLMPVALFPISDGVIRRPKYLASNYQMADFGYEGDCIVGARLTPTDDVDITAKPDVFRFPDALDAQVGGGLVDLKTALEDRHIPSEWINAGMTYREVARKICAISEFLQGVCGSVKLFQPIIGGGITLRSQFSDLPLNAQQMIQFASDKLGVDKTEFTGALPLGRVLKTAADKLEKPRMFFRIQV